MAKAVKFVRTIGFVMLINRHLDYQGVSEGTRVSVDDLEVDISCGILGYFAGSIEMALKDG